MDEVLKQKGRYLDFLDILLTAKDDSGTGLTHREIRDEVDTFLFEGSSAGLSLNFPPFLL
jgi:cytochrome P450